MDYLFRGLRRGSGEPVTGRVTAPSENAVLELLESHAVVVDTLGPEEAGGLFPPTLEAALDAAGLRITFNQLARVHEGHGVWIVDHDKVPGRVAQLAREAIGSDPARQPALQRIERALETLYGDAGPAPIAATVDLRRFASADDVQAEVGRLRSAIRKLEQELVSMRARRPADVEPRRVQAERAPRDRTRDAVLREIFQHNLELMKLTEGPGDVAPHGEQGRDRLT